MARPALTPTANVIGVTVLQINGGSGLKRELGSGKQPKSENGPDREIGPVPLEFEICLQSVFAAPVDKALAAAVGSVGVVARLSVRASAVDTAEGELADSESAVGFTFCASV